jgi:hypothetical protein
MAACGSSSLGHFVHGSPRLAGRAEFEFEFEFDELMRRLYRSTNCANKVHGDFGKEFGGWTFLRPSFLGAT